MDDKMFDAWVGRAARTADRRAMLGLFAGMVLAALPSATSAGNDSSHGGGGGKDHGGGKGKGGKKKKKKSSHGSKGNQTKCNADEHECYADFASYCYYRYYFSGQTHIDLCQDSFFSCCGGFHKCTAQAYAAADQCLVNTSQVW